MGIMAAVFADVSNERILRVVFGKPRPMDWFVQASEVVIVLHDRLCLLRLQFCERANRLEKNRSEPFALLAEYGLRIMIIAFFPRRQCTRPWGCNPAANRGQELDNLGLSLPLPRRFVKNTRPRQFVP